MHLTPLLSVVSVLGTVSGQKCHPIRYMAIGDSVTEITCWRAYLWQMLQDSGYANVNFVGSNTAQSYLGCSVPSYGRYSEGHSGYTAIGIANINVLPKWLDGNPTDIATIHLGSNDISHGHSTEEILDAFSTLVAQMREANQEMKIIVAQVFPISIGLYANKVAELNARIPLWAETMSTASSPILIVDQYSNFTREDSNDGLHPNDQGDKKMAARWYPAMVRSIHAMESH